VPATARVAHVVVLAPALVPGQVASRWQRALAMVPVRVVWRRTRRLTAAPRGWGMVGVSVSVSELARVGVQRGAHPFLRRGRCEGRRTALVWLYLPAAWLGRRRLMVGGGDTGEYRGTWGGWGEET